MWSAVLGLAGSALGAASASRTAAAQMAQQQYQFDKQMEMQGLQVGMAIDAQRRQAEENVYQRQIEQMNRLIAGQERNYQKQQASSQRDQLMAERREQIERQIQEDREAAKQRQFQLEQLLQNQDLRAEERDFAIQQLEEAKATASGERDEDLRRFLEERAMAQIERDFVVGEYEDYKRQAEAERQEELAVREQILNQIYGLQDSLTGAQAELGYIPEIQQITEADIAREIERRSGEYTADVDRAATAVASVNEADLIRNGMDLSTTGNRRRADITRQLASEYQDARQRAYDDAMSYIAGKSDTMASNVGNIIDRRAANLGETANVAGAGLAQLQNLRNLPSATDAYRMASALPSAIYNRSVSSANDFRAPVNINSAVYDGISIGPGLASYRVPTSAAMNLSSGVSSAIFNPYSVGIPNPQSYMQNAGQIGNQLLSSSTTSANNAYNNAYKASAGFGSDMRSFMDDNSSSIDKWFDSKFGTSFAGK